jgi:Ca-activated chloride channel family protein
MRFALDMPWAVGAAIGLALAAAGIVWLEIVRRRKRLGRLGPVAMLERLVPPAVVHQRLGRRPVWLGAAALFAGVAFAGPRWGEPIGEAETEGIDVVFAIDASLSMTATDDSPNRLERAKQEARRLRALSRGDRVGLIAFAGRSYILTPLTADDGALALFLDNLDPSIVGQPGSSLGAALRQGVDLLGPASGGDRALVVFTDGETFDERADVLEAARRAKKAGVSVVFVGFGTEDGSRIPIRAPNDAIVPKRAADGSIVVTRYDANMLRAAATEAEGTLVDAYATDKASRIRSALNGLRAERRRVTAQRAIPLRYHWFLAPALLLLLWDGYVAGRRARVAALGLLIAVGAPAPAAAQTGRLLEEAQRHYEAQRPLAAARSWRRAMEAGDRQAQTLYNMGTAYLGADSLNSAIEVLERAVTMPAPALRSDALFNLGLAYLKRGLATRGDAAATSYRGAIRAYRSVLLQHPDDEDARWNYELAMKKLQSSQSSSSSSNNPNQPREERQSPRLASDQASQLLDAAAREERDVQGRRQRSQPTNAARGRDW